VLIDAGIRLGEAMQQDMIALRLTRSFKAILVASKAYVEAKGAPRTISDLHDHNCIGFTGLWLEWEGSIPTPDDAQESPFVANWENRITGNKPAVSCIPQAYPGRWVSSRF